MILCVCICPHQYWRGVAAQLKLPVCVLDAVQPEAAAVARTNPWLTYGEALHRAREFDVCVPAVEALGERPLEKVGIHSRAFFLRNLCDNPLLLVLFQGEIKALAEVLLSTNGGGRAALPDPDTVDWPTFVAAVDSEQNRSPTGKVYCPLHQQPMPWIDVAKLAQLRSPQTTAEVCFTGDPGTRPGDHSLTIHSPTYVFIVRLHPCAGVARGVGADVVVDNASPGPGPHPGARAGSRDRALRHRGRISHPAAVPEKKRRGECRREPRFSRAVATVCDPEGGARVVLQRSCDAHFRHPQGAPAWMSLPYAVVP